MNKFITFIFAIVVSFIPGAIGYMFTPRGASDVWYNALNKSALTPPGWVFGVAWTILYALLGIALYLIIVSPKSNQLKGRAYLLFAVQMALNALWTYLFFGLQMPAAALIILILLIIFTVWMTRIFRQIRPAAAYMVWPYILWMLFATYLNSTIVFWN